MDRQQVNIARALYYDADVVALDDPLSAGPSLRYLLLLQTLSVGQSMLM